VNYVTSTDAHELVGS